ncbi:hypothetical protein ACIQ9P_04210 [Kitasatospora sp. NPDC094019]|uniref:hypothetical protein n=1 Tax=Kitasatospora sp. NPDC094019 TaxID=3364091 RepID=UPI003807A968
MPDDEQVPPGPRRNLLLALHALYEEAGKPSLTKLSAAIRADNSLDSTLSREGVSDLLNGTHQQPRWRNLVALVSVLAAFSQTRLVSAESKAEVVSQFNGLWRATQEEPKVLPSGPRDPFAGFPDGVVALYQSSTWGVGSDLLGSGVLIRPDTVLTSIEAVSNLDDVRVIDHGVELGVRGSVCVPPGIDEGLTVRFGFPGIRLFRLYAAARSAPMSCQRSDGGQVKIVGYVELESASKAALRVYEGVLSIATGPWHSIFLEDPPGGRSELASLSGAAVVHPQTGALHGILHGPQRGTGPFNVVPLSAMESVLSLQDERDRHRE